LGSPATLADPLSLGTATTAITTTATALTGGVHTIIAVYTPDGTDLNFATSTSANFSQTVNKQGSATTIISAAPKPTTFGTGVLLKATVTPSVGGVEPSGTVSF